MQCECLADGFCHKFQRPMHGRMRQICQGINVDIGTAAAFRLQWGKEVPAAKHLEPRRLVLKTNQAPGDAVAMTAAVYSLHRAHPGRFITAVESPYPEIFEGNPDVVATEGEPLEMHYPAIHDSNSRGIHFMQAWCEFLGFALDVNVPLLTNRPRIYREVSRGPHYVVCAGGKSDFTNKHWPYYQEVIDASPDFQWIQVGLDQAPLKGVKSLVGKTSLSQLMDLVATSRGVLCGVSLAMHLAAAFEKPAVVVAGGREPVQWNAYPKQHYLHTVGQLPCCENGGCWKSRTVPLGDGFDSSLCERPVGSVPECMTLIKPKHVTSWLHKDSAL